MHAQSAPASASGTVAVERFSNISGAPDDAWMGSGIAETLVADLTDSARVVILVTTSPAGASGDDAAGARWIVNGGYQRLGDDLRITARIVDTQSGTAVHRVRVDGQAADFFAMQDELSARLREGLPLRTATAPTGTTVNTTRPATRSALTCVCAGNISPAVNCSSSSTTSATRDSPTRAAFRCSRTAPLSSSSPGCSGSST